MKTPEQMRSEESGDARSRIVAAAAKLIGEGGADAATTRAVAVAASVQAPTIYRLFGDKDGLLDAVAEHVLAQFVAKKAQHRPSADPVADLRQGWHAYLEFGFSHPALFAIMNMPRPGSPSSAAAAGLEVLQARVSRIAGAGRLLISEEAAVDLVHAMGVGAVLTLSQKPKTERDRLSMDTWETVAARVIGPAPPTHSTGIVATAMSLRARLRDVVNLTPGERALMDELLQRIGSGHP